MLKYADLEADQLKAIEFIVSGEDSLVCADVGTGKTVISLTAAKKLPVKRWLVLAPKLVCTETWAKEPDNWEHLNDVTIAVAVGTAEQRLKAINSYAQFTIINYENLGWLLEQFPVIREGKKKIDTLPFDGLICDEIDKLKTVSSKRFKDFRNRIGIFDYRIGLTGTLQPNDLTEIWGQVYMVDGGQTFGRSFYKWRAEHFYPIDFQQHNWRVLPGEREKIVAKLEGLAYRLEAKGLPEVFMCPPIKLPMPKDIRPLYDKLAKDFYIEFDDADGDKRDVDAASAGILVGKLQQLSAGFTYIDPKECPICYAPPELSDKGKWFCAECEAVVPREAVWHGQDKMRTAVNYIGKLTDAGRQVMVVYHFREELDRLRKMLPGVQYLGAGATDRQAQKALDDWNAKKLKVLAIHPAAAGHGLNLQKTGAHQIVALTVPWSGGMLKQVCGRLARRGNVADTIYFQSFEYENSVDRHVLDTVGGRGESLQKLLDDIGEFNYA